MVKQSPVKAVVLNAIDVKSFKVSVEGMTPFISHKFSERNMNQMEEKQRKENTKERKARISIEDEVADCIHRLDNGKVGYPTDAFYNGMREVAPYLTNMDKKLVQGSVKVSGSDGCPLVEIKHSKQVTQKDFVKLSSGVADVRYRPRFEGWSCELFIRYNAAQISPEQIITLINLAGFHRGIGDHRPGSPKKPGDNGMYRVKETVK